MTVPHSAVDHGALDHGAHDHGAHYHEAEPLDSAEPLTVDAAYARARQAALADSALGQVGLEIETHLVDLDAVADPVASELVRQLPGLVAAAAGRSAVTLEPGAQFE